MPQSHHNISEEEYERLNGSTFTSSNATLGTMTMNLPSLKNQERSRPKTAIPHLPTSPWAGNQKTTETSIGHSKDMLVETMTLSLSTCPWRGTKPTRDWSQAPPKFERAKWTQPWDAWY